jgi:hypothetical protein
LDWHSNLQAGMHCMQAYLYVFTWHVGHAPTTGSEQRRVSLVPTSASLLLMPFRAREGTSAQPRSSSVPWRRCAPGSAQTSPLRHNYYSVVREERNRDCGAEVIFFVCPERIEHCRSPCLEKIRCRCTERLGPQRIARRIRSRAEYAYSV